MIQDIEPRQLDNQYKNKMPKPQSFIFLFEGNTVLAKRAGDEVAYPDYENLQYYKSQPWALSGSLLYGFFCELDGDDSIHLQEEELSVGKWVDADELDMEDDGVSLTREMISKFVREHRSNKLFF